MAERGNEGGMSPQTMAIIDRLQKEGNLLRNSGTNSIRSVKMDLAKFGGVFDSISTQLADQTSYFASLDSRNEAMLEEQRRQADLKELEDDAPNPVAEEIARLTEQADLLNAQTSLMEAQSKNREEKGGIMAMLKSFLPSMSSMQNIALGGAGLFLGYNMVKGLIDGRTGGAFTQFENEMIRTFKQVDWGAVGDSFIEFASKVPTALTAITDFLSSPLGAIAAGSAAIAAANPGLLLRGASLLTPGPRPTTVPTTGGPPAPAGGARNLMTARNAGLAVAGGAAIIYADDIGDWVSKNVVGLTDDEIKNTSVDEFVGITAAVAGGATIGSMFGPKGALVGAAVGGIIGVGQKLHEIVSRTDLEDIDAVAVAERVANANAEAAKEMLAKVETGEITGLSDAQIASLRESAQGPTEEMIRETNDAIAENLRDAEEKLKNLQETGPKFYVEASGQVFNPETGMMEQARYDITDPERIQEIQAEYDANLAAAQQTLTDIQALGQARLEAGLATADDLTFVDPVGWWENFKDTVGLEESSDRRARREAELDAVAGAGGGGQVNVVVGGDTVNAVGGSTAVKQGDRTSVVGGRSAAAGRSNSMNDYGGMAQ
jgi:hypothetical protein